MNNIPINSQPQTPHEETGLIKLGTTGNPYPRKQSDSALFSKDGTPNFQAINSSRLINQKLNVNINDRAQEVLDFDLEDE